MRTDTELVTNWNTPAPCIQDGGTPRPHRIRCSSGWQGCRGSHEHGWQVRECWAAKRSGAWPCDWLVEAWSEDGPVTIACGAPCTWLPEEGKGVFGCPRHTHVPAGTRRAQGWDYAEDAGEAELLARAGTEPRTMAGQVWPA